MTDNPLWFVFILTGVVSAYLSISTGVDHESSEKSPKKGLIISIIVTALIAIGLGILVAFTGDIITGALIGVIVFICFLIPSLYVYYLRIKQQD